MPDATLPSIGQAIAQTLSENPPSGNLEASRSLTEPVETKEPVTEAPKETVLPVKETSKALSDFTSDDPEPEVQKVNQADQREGEKPAQYIKRLKQERADALAQV